MSHLLNIRLLSASIGRVHRGWRRTFRNDSDLPFAVACTAWIRKCTQRLIGSVNCPQMGDGDPRSEAVRRFHTRHRHEARPCSSTPNGKPHCRGDPSTVPCPCLRPPASNRENRTEGFSAMTTTSQRFLIRYKKNDGSQHTLQLHAANPLEARIVAMETNTYLRRYPTSVDSILEAA